MITFCLSRSMEGGLERKFSVAFEAQTNVLYFFLRIKTVGKGLLKYAKNERELIWIEYASSFPHNFHVITCLFFSWELQNKLDLPLRKSQRFLVAQHAQAKFLLFFHLNMQLMLFTTGQPSLSEDFKIFLSVKTTQ